MTKLINKIRERFFWKNSYIKLLEETITKRDVLIEELKDTIYQISKKPVKQIDKKAHKNGVAYLGAKKCK